MKVLGTPHIHHVGKPLYKVDCKFSGKMTVAVYAESKYEALKVILNHLGDDVTLDKIHSEKIDSGGKDVCISDNPMVASSQIDEYREHKDALIKKWSETA